VATVSSWNRRLNIAARWRSGDGMTTRAIPAVFLVAVLCGVLPAAAQPEAFVLSGVVPGCTFDCGGTILRVAPDTPAVLSSVVDPAGAAATSPYVTPDGGLLVWFTPVSGSRPARLAVRDLVNGRTTTIDVPGAGAMAGNPARPEVYVFDARGVSAYGVAGVRRFNAPDCTLTIPVSVSGDGRRLLYFCQGDFAASQPNRAFLLDTTTGQLVTTLPDWLTAALNHDGSAAYVVQFVNQAQRLQKIALPGGTVLMDVAVPVVLSMFGGFPIWDVHADHRQNRVLLVSRYIHAFDGDSLTLLNSGGLSLSGQVVSASHSALDDVGHRLYVTGSAISFGSTSLSFEVFDSNTLAPVVAVSAAVPGEFVPVPKPAPPTGLAATVTGGSVSFGWAGAAAPPTTARFVLEAGSGPGLSDIVAGLDLGLQTSFAASGVPPGRYYVRVRAGNYAGLGAPSNEVVVQVP
jgi:hypothetical protein